MADNSWFGPHPQQSIINAGAWAAIATFGNALLSLTGTIILSRLLEPSEVGLFSLAFAFYSIPSMAFGPGLQAAAVQAQDLTEQQSSNLFWINVAINGALAVLLVTTAPMIAAFFQQPLMRLFCPVFALILLLEGFATQYRALLARAMRFDLVAKIQLTVGTMSMVVAIVLAWMGFGAWALVMQVLVGAIADRLALAAVVPWRPSWFAREDGIRRLVHFSAGSSLTLGMHMIYTQAQAILMGRLASVSEIGFYNRGQSLFQKPFAQILGPLHAVLLPALASRQQDRDELGAALSRANSMLYAILPPLVVWMMTSAGDIAVSLLGDSWKPAGDALFWFACGSIPLILFGCLWKGNEAVGRPTWGLGIRVAFLPILLAGLTWAAPHGAATMAAVGAVVEWASAPVILWMLIKDGPVPHRYFVRPMAECVFVVAANLAFMWVLKPWISALPVSAVMRSGLSLALCYVIGLSVAQAFPFGRAAYKEWLGLVRIWLRGAGMSPV
jgi:PST family polysaccharide transporter